MPDPVRLNDRTRYIVGFFLHQKCGDIAFWATDYPKTGELTSEYDRQLNGGQGVMMLNDETGWATCRSCRSMVCLKTKYFRAIPRHEDLRAAPPGPFRGIDLKGNR